jgi:hypothetical protein
MNGKEKDSCTWILNMEYMEVYGDEDESKSCFGKAGVWRNDVG